MAKTFAADRERPTTAAIFRNNILITTLYRKRDTQVTLCASYSGRERALAGASEMAAAAGGLGASGAASAARGLVTGTVIRTDVL